jgi:hypothetical protein
VFNSKKNSTLEQIRRLKNSVLQFSHLPFDEILSTVVLRNIVQHSASSRDRIFTPLVTLKAFIFQSLSTDGSCRQAVAHVLSERLLEGIPAISIETGAYCKARKRLPLEPLQQAVAASGKALHEQADQTWLWKGHDLATTDGSTIQMPDTPENQAVFPQQSNQKPGLGFPIARLVVLISLSVGSIIAYATAPYQGKGSGETSLFSQMISHIANNSLLLEDRYYCTWAILALILQQGGHMLVQNHAQRKPNFNLGQRLGPKDHLITWEKPKRKPVWISQDAYDALPGEIGIREFAVAGKVYVTTLLNAKRYPRKELFALYSKRWQVELDLRSIKTHMKMDVLRCKSPELVQKEIAVFLLAYNLVRASIARAAASKGKIPRLISFMTAVQLLNASTSQLILSTGNLLEHMINGLLEAIASIPIAQQKRKPQPRAIKRRPKPYPLLTVPRNQACEAILSN